jgi:hypothetical protein
MLERADGVRRRVDAGRLVTQSGKRMLGAGAVGTPLVRVDVDRGLEYYVDKVQTYHPVQISCHCNKQSRLVA